MAVLSLMALGILAFFLIELLKKRLMESTVDSITNSWASNRIDFLLR